MPLENIINSARKIENIHNYRELNTYTVTIVGNTIKELDISYNDISEINLSQGSDLEVLNILKKHYDNNSLALSLNSFIVFTIHNDDKDFHKIKEWLENE